MDQVRLGIIGIGNMGSGHCRNILEGKCPDVKLAAIADIAEERRTFAKENYPTDVAIFSDGMELLDSGLVDAVIVAVPHYEHPKYVMAALSRGIHAMSEKPAGVYTKQVREMNEAAAQSDAIFAMMFNQRTDHIYRKMKEIVESGELGEIRRTSLIITNWYRPQAYYDSGAWRATWAGEGGGVLLNQCPHNLDYWQWICGMPKKVQAFMSFGKYHDIEVEDDVTAYVEYPNGATGTFVTTTGDCAGTNRFEINFDQGKLVSENGKLYMWKAECSEQEWSKNCTIPFGAPKLTMTEVETDGKSEQHVGVLNAFAGAILRGEPLVARGEEGINGLTLSNAMHLSAWLGKPVELPFDEDLYYEELKKRIATSRLKDHVVAAVADLADTYNTK
ncbi:MAG: Gfo/Idh/MocA family oxidoreductase [Ruminococcaceae bacterium]|nr:Gfo/Idh/MocA family oxidoreductase [Oscillospiraceae bacterium]